MNVHVPGFVEDIPDNHWWFVGLVIGMVAWLAIGGYVFYRLKWL